MMNLFRQRRGFTLPELLVALLVFSILSGVILTLVIRQQRFYGDAAEVIKVQSELRQGSAVLPIDLRGISTSDTLVNAVANRNSADIYARSDKAIDFRRIYGTSVLCRRRSTAPFDTIMLVPKTLLSGAALTTWGATPAVGDSLLILDEGKLIGAEDDRWRSHEVRQIMPVTGAAGCPFKTVADETPLLAIVDTLNPSFHVIISPPLDAPVLVQSPVRVFRRARYELYQSSDALWYLGYSECSRKNVTLSKCSNLTPVSGPYRPYVNDDLAASGLIFTYYNRFGTLLDATAPSREVARIDVVMRGQTLRAVTRTGSGAGDVYTDTLVLSIGIRNRL
jgi:prepilin-type N-terminal cleavage/methylation domain-containing protein